MQHEPFVIAFDKYRWILSRHGKALGTFRFRASALKGAVEALYWGAGSREDEYVLVFDRNGALYTAWRSDRDVLTLSR